MKCFFLMIASLVITVVFAAPIAPYSSHSEQEDIDQFSNSNKRDSEENVFRMFRSAPERLFDGSARRVEEDETQPLLIAQPSEADILYEFRKMLAATKTVGFRNGY